MLPAHHGLLQSFALALLCCISLLFCEHTRFTHDALDFSWAEDDGLFGWVLFGNSSLIEQGIFLSHSNVLRPYILYNQRTTHVQYLPQVPDMVLGDDTDCLMILWLGGRSRASLWSFGATFREVLIFTFRLERKGMSPQHATYSQPNYSLLILQIL